MLPVFTEFLTRVSSFSYAITEVTMTLSVCLSVCHSAVRMSTELHIITVRRQSRLKGYFHYGCALRCVASDSQR